MFCIIIKHVHDTKLNVDAYIKLQKFTNKIIVKQLEDIFKEIKSNNPISIKEIIDNISNDNLKKTLYEFVVTTQFDLLTRIAILESEISDIHKKMEDLHATIKDQDNGGVNGTESSFSSSSSSE